MKKILMLLAFAGVASVASAQQTMTVTEYEVIQVQDKYQVITNPFWSNWFFSVGGGAQVLYGNNDHIVRIVGVSPDSERSHRNFCAKHDLNFTLLADTDHSVCEAFGVWAEKSMYGRKYMGVLRTTFVIDAEGRIEKIFTKVDTKNHYRQIADAYKQAE